MPVTKQKAAKPAQEAFLKANKTNISYPIDKALLQLFGAVEQVHDVALQELPVRFKLGPLQRQELELQTLLERVQRYSHVGDGGVGERDVEVVADVCEVVSRAQE